LRPTVSSFPAEPPCCSQGFGGVEYRRTGATCPCVKEPPLFTSLGRAVLAGVAPETPVKAKSLDGFFKNATKEEEWHDPQEKAEVQRFKQLVQTLQDTLKDAKVFLVGKRESDAFLVGRVDSGWAGLKTKVIQT
jgi:hypothetical protein